MVAGAGKVCKAGDSKPCESPNILLQKKTKKLLRDFNNSDVKMNKSARSKWLADNDVSNIRSQVASLVEKNPQFQTLLDNIDASFPELRPGGKTGSTTQTQTAGKSQLESLVEKYGGKISPEDLKFLAQSKNTEAKTIIMGRLKAGKAKVAKTYISKLKAKPKATISDFNEKAGEAAKHIDQTMARTDLTEDQKQAEVQKTYQNADAETKDLLDAHYNSPENANKPGAAIIKKAFAAAKLAIQSAIENKQADAVKTAVDVKPADDASGTDATQVSADAQANLDKVIEGLQETNEALRENISNIVKETDEQNEEIVENKDAQKKEAAKKTEAKDDTKKMLEKLETAKKDSTEKIEKIKEKTNEAVKIITDVLTVLKSKVQTPEVKARIAKLEKLLSNVLTTLNSGTKEGLIALAETVSELTALVTIIKQLSASEVTAVREMLAQIQVQIQEIVELGNINKDSGTQLAEAIEEKQIEAEKAPDATKIKEKEKLSSAAKMKKRAEIKKLFYSSGVSTMPQLAKKMDTLIGMAGTKEAALNAIEQLLKRIQTEKLSERAALNEAAKIEEGISKNQGVKVAEKLSPAQKLRTALDSNRDFKAIYSELKNDDLSGVSDKMKLELAIKALKNAKTGEKEKVVDQLRELGVSEGIITAALKQSETKSDTELALEHVEGGTGKEFAGGSSGNLANTNREKGGLSLEKPDEIMAVGNDSKVNSKGAVKQALAMRLKEKSANS